MRVTLDIEIFGADGELLGTEVTHAFAIDGRFFVEDDRVRVYAFRRGILTSARCKIIELEMSCDLPIERLSDYNVFKRDLITMQWNGPVCTITEKVSP